MVKSRSSIAAFCTTKTRHPRIYMQVRYMKSQLNVEQVDKPYDFS